MGNILKAIGRAFAWVYNKVVKGGNPTVQLPADLQITPAEIDECIKAVNIVKSVVDSGAVVLITDLTPISMDNEVRLAISNALPGVLAGLTFAKQEIAAAQLNDTDAVNAALAKIKMSDNPDKDSLYHALCARLIMIASNGKVSWSDAVSILELYFKNMFGITIPAPVAAPAAPPAQVAAPAPVADPVVTDTTAQPTQPTPEAEVEIPALTPAQIAAIIAKNTPATA